MGFESPLFLRCFVAADELVDLCEHLIGILERVGWPRSTWSHHAGMQYLSDEVNYEKTMSDVNPRHGNTSKPKTE